MNYIWCLMIIVSIVVSIFNGTVDQTINGAFEGAKSAVFTVLSFAGVMCFWTDRKSTRLNSSHNA